MAYVPESLTAEKPPRGQGLVAALELLSQAVQPGIQRNEARAVEQPLQVAVVVATLLQGYIEDQHAVITTTGKGVRGVTGNHARMQAADRPAGAAHFKVGATSQAQHQLVLGMRMRGALARQVENAGYRHVRM